MSPPNKPRRGPESRFFDTLKGKRVKIELYDGDVVEAKLLWVDRYSLGLAGGGLDSLDQTTPVLMYKQAICRLQLAEGTGDEGDREGSVG